MDVAAMEIDPDAVRGKLALGQRGDARQLVLPALHVEHAAPVVLDGEAHVRPRHREPPHGVQTGGIFAARAAQEFAPRRDARSEEHTSELQSLMRISYAVFCLKKQNTNYIKKTRR